MKKSIVASSVLIGILGLSGGYLYSASANNQTVVSSDNTASAKVESEKPDHRLTVKDINNQDELFKALYQEVNPSHLTQDERTAYEQALKYEMRVSRLGDHLEAYRFQGIREYTNQGEQRFIAIFTHEDAAVVGGAPDGDSVDLYVFKKLDDQYVLLARTGKDGLLNSTGGSRSVENITVDHIKNADPIDLGQHHKGYIVDFKSLELGGSFNELNILWLNENSGEIYNTAKDMQIQHEGTEVENNESYDSFYTLNTNSSHNQLYDLNVYTTGQISSDQKGKLVSNDKHRVYQFDGKTYKLAATTKNQYSSLINYEGYTKLFSLMNQSGYAPIPYGSLASAFDNIIDYWFGTGIRFFKPIAKNAEYFTWKVQGTKLYGLDVIGVQRGVCDISGDDRCGEAAYSAIIFDQPLEAVRAKLLENSHIDYTKSFEERYPERAKSIRESGEEIEETPILEEVKFEGKPRALLVLPLGDEDEGVAEETW
jgi:hypothetical protein